MFPPLTPFMDETALWNQISKPLALEYSGTTLQTRSTPWPPFGNDTGNTYPPARHQIPSLLCPSDGPTFGTAADTNYAINWGRQRRRRAGHQPAPRPAGCSSRGASLSLGDARDGTVNTLLFGEIGRAEDRSYQGGRAGAASSGYAVPASCLTAAANPTNPGYYLESSTAYKNGRGGYWGPGRTASPPASSRSCRPTGPSCGPNTGNDDSFAEDVTVTAGSYHPGGIQVVMVDGSVKFLSETINAGTSSAANVTSGKSPYGTWGALGTRSGGEVVDGY